MSIEGFIRQEEMRMRENYGPQAFHYFVGQLSYKLRDIDCPDQCRKELAAIEDETRLKAEELGIFPRNDAHFEEKKGYSSWIMQSIRSSREP